MKYELEYTSLNEFALDYYMDDVKNYFDAFFVYHHKDFLNSNLFTKWCKKLWNKEPKETAKIIKRTFYFYYETIQNTTKAR